MNDAIFSIADIVTLGAILAALLGAWFGLRSKLDDSCTKADARHKAMLDQQQKLTDQIDRMGRHSADEHERMIGFIKDADDRHIRAHEKMGETLIKVLAHHEARNRESN